MESDKFERSDAPHVLVIDGDDSVLARTCDLLETAGYRVSTADLPDIGIVRRIEPDVMIVGMSYRGRPAGLAFLEHNATDPVLAKVPAVAQVDMAGLSAADRERLRLLPHVVVDYAQEGELPAVLARLLAPVGV
jgi:CheY-like chemotaxis protein